MTITRRYQPEHAAEEELVDVLYQLLLDAPADRPEPADHSPSALPESTCNMARPE